jgi:3-oxoacid CoA-transferase subunit B
MGGAMDLVAGAQRVIVVMEHVTRTGEHKVLETCTLPLTGRACVDRIITDRAVFDVTDGGLELIELAPEETVESIRERTGCGFRVADHVAGTVPA